MADKEKRAQSKAQMKNLYQYRDLTDEQFDSMWEKKVYEDTHSVEFDNRIDKKIEEFSQDYDIDDLKINDRETLRAFVQAIIALEDYERIVFDIRSQDTISQININVVDRISKVMSDLRKDISRFQEDLNITRKIRKSDKESSVVAYITNLKEQARQYYESKMSFIYCDKCDMLLGNLWTLYPEEDNKLILKCSRTLDDGSKCGNKVTVTTKQLMDNRGTNKISITPEALL
jgi:hypothetical protein